jgi:hypothetical protein
MMKFIHPARIAAHAKNRAGLARRRDNGVTVTGE